MISTHMPDLTPTCPTGWNILLSDRRSGAHALALRALDLAATARLRRNQIAECFRVLATAHPSMQILKSLHADIAQAGTRDGLLRVKRRLQRSNALVADNFERELRRSFPRRFDLKVVTLSRSSTVQAALVRGRRRIAAIAFARSFPLGEGRIACAEAMASGVPGRVFQDARLRQEVKQCDLALVGADSVLSDGSVVNKVGTALLAKTCARERKPLWVVASRYKFSEKDSIDLIQRVGRKRIRLFDVTPSKLVGRVITERR